MPAGEPAEPAEPAESAAAAKAPQASPWSVDELIPFGKYILLNKLGSGAIAVAYRAKLRGEAGFERIVTVKRVLPQMAGDEEFVETFVREAKICARLTHGNICPIYELGKVGESLYMALQWVAGKDLGAIARRLQFTGKVMPPLAAAWIASRLCDALDYAHGLKDASGNRLNILHQDLSPSNIVISYEGEVKLIDFGIARASGRAQQTNVEALKQKIGYMSPEMVLGTAIDQRSDVFGVGVCLYEMVTGRRLFGGADDISTLRLVSAGVVPPPSALLEDTPEELELIMMRALARDPDARWPSAGEMAHALTACVAAEDPTFGTRNIATLMRELFEQDAAAEQRKMHELITASQDAKLMEQRRRFFASPLGAAAVAKAEAARKLASARPAPAATGVAPESGTRQTQTAGAKAPAQPPPQPVVDGEIHSAPPPEPEASDEELTTYRAEQRVAAAISSIPARPSDTSALTRAATYEELTRDSRDRRSDAPTFRPKVPDPSAAQSDSDSAELMTHDALEVEEEPTTFRPEASAQPDQRPTLPVPDPAAAAAKPIALVATKTFEEEPTSYFMPDRPSESEYTSLPDELVLGPFEEEATQIFFSTDEGLGEELTTALSAARLLAPPPAAGHAVAAGGSSAHRTRAVGQVLKAPQASGKPPTASLAAPSTASPAERERRAKIERRKADRVERGPTQPLSIPPAQAAKGGKGPLLWVVLALIVIAIAGVLANSSLGVALGLRKPANGVIEVRTAPEVPATVRLDGIYRGRAPLRLEGVPAGNRILALEAEGYAPVSRLITLEGGAVVKESISLNPNSQSAAAAR